MTPDAFLDAFSAALERPGARLGSHGRLLRFLVPTGRQDPPEAVCDPVGIVWWARTGHAATIRLLDSERDARALGLEPAEALALCQAADGLHLDEPRVAWWRAELNARIAATFASELGQHP